MSELIKISGLWKKKDKGGNMLLSGSIGGIDILILKNKKEKNSHPDYELLIKKRDIKQQPAILDDGIDLMDRSVEDCSVVGEEEIPF